jgi:chromosome segregation ATPase
MALVLSHEGHIEKMSREISRLNRELNTWKDRAEKALTTKMEAWKTNDIVKAELAEQRMYAESYVKEVLLLRSENASLQAKLAGGQPDPVKFGCYDAEMAAEIARLRAELDDTLRLWNEGVEAQRRQYDFDLNELRAELAKYTGDLTDEQADAVGVLRDPCGVSMTHYYKFIDAAIRKVRSGEGEG